MLVRISWFDNRMEIIIYHRRTASLARIFAHLARRNQASSRHQIQKFLFGRAFIHRHIAAWKLHLHAEVLSDGPEHFILVNRVSRRVSQRFGVARIGILVPPFRQIGYVLALKTLLGCKHDIRTLGAGAHPWVNLNEQFQIIQCAAHLELVGETDFGVATNRYKRPDLAFARCQDFIRHHIARHFEQQLAKPAETRFGHPFDAEHRGWRRDLRALLAHLDGKNAGNAALFAFLLEARAHRVEACHQILCQRAIARHFRAGASDSAAF